MKGERKRVAHRQTEEGDIRQVGGVVPHSDLAVAAAEGFDSFQLPTTTETTTAKRETPSLEALASAGGLGASITFPEQRHDGGAVARVEPVVLLLGWLHGADVHLAKYSTFYHEHGYVTIRVPVRMALFTPNPKGSSRARLLIDLLTHERLAGRPVVFHAFSNGGCMVLAELMQEQQRREAAAASNRVQSASSAADEEEEQRRCRRILVVGTVFDSAPSRVGFSRSVRALTAHIRNSLTRRLVQALVAVAISAIWARRRAAAAAVRLGASPPQPLLYELLHDMPCFGPELYLYSTADLIVSHRDIASFAAHRRLLGVDVTEVCWNDSGHVSHMPAHRGEYTASCLSFVDSCCGRYLTPRSRL